MKMNNDNPFRVAVCGLGNHAVKNVIPAVSTCPATELAGVFTRRESIRQAVSDTYNCPTFDSFEAVLSCPTVEAIYLATPTGLHFEQGIAVLQSGKHLICEKPLTTDPVQSLALINTAIKNQLVLAETFMFLFHPQFQKIKELALSADFGEIRSLHCNFGIPPLSNPGFRDSLVLGGGAFLDVGSYTISLASQLLNKTPEVCFVDIENYKQMIDKSGSAVLKFNASQHAFLNWGYERAYRADIMIWGTKASLYSDKIFSKPADFQPTIVYRNLNGVSETVHISAANSFVEMLRYFSEAVQNQIKRERLYQQAKRQAEIISLFHSSLGVDSNALSR